jgi:cbb3-type cytochrome oxidase cytochrome c subunit
MADRGDTHYKIATLNRWFLLSSVLLLASCVWMVLDDWSRPWKRYQRDFRELELARAENDQAELAGAGALQTEEQLLAQVAQAEQDLAARSSEVAQAQESLRLVKGDLWNATEAAKKVKSQFNWDRYIIEERRTKADDPSLEAELLAQSERRMNEAISLQQEQQARLGEAQAKLAGLTAQLDQAKKALAAGTRDLEAVRKRVTALAPVDPAQKVAQVIRDAPGLDFIGPSLKVEKVVLDNLTFELNFTKKKRIDMCHTCHVGIDRAGFEQEAQPSQSHPRLDLYVSSKSPHPLKDFGCTICHRGSGEALDFVRADHRPADQQQAKQWQAEHHWHKQHHWDYPMLASSMTEASCVQCHKTSMELIAEDAPVVAKGYRLAERYGCYACHKIEWFPTKRRPGPSLENLQAKLPADFIAAWIAGPKEFRPTTWMPQFFHLENYAPEESVVKSEYGAGRDILGKEWDQSSIDAITAFLIDRAPKQPLPKVPVQGDPVRGRETMRLVGCLSCHNMAPYGDAQPATKDLALERRGTNEHGPNLRGINTKVNADWLFWWIKDPANYWSETLMPNLRLSDEEAADIVAYVMEDPDGIFSDVPQGWTGMHESLPEAQLREVLSEQARWLFAREGRATIEARLEGKVPGHRWDQTQSLKVAVGEKLVGQYGCFSCHEIAGMKDMMPIGTELTNWGSKTVDKLDFAFGAHLFGLDPQYREGWLAQKLSRPRSFDLEKVKNPSEKLRMPWFRFSEDEVQAITTFVVGLVDDEVQRARMNPTPVEAAMDAGMRAVRQKNCVACHMIDPGQVTYVDDQGKQRTVAAELIPVGDSKTPPAHELAAVQRDAADFEVDEIGVRVLRTEPEIGKRTGDKLFIPVDKLVSLNKPNGGDFVRVVTDYYFNGIELFDPKAPNAEEAYSYVTAAEDGVSVFDVDGQARDRSVEPYDKVRWTYAPPVLWNEGHKVKRNWFVSFLGEVVPLREQIRVRMPSFRYTAGEASAIADYFAHKSVQEWPAEYARSLRSTAGKDLAALCKQAGLSPATWLAIENGSAADTAANFARVLSAGKSLGFTMEPAVNLSYEPNPLRSAAYLAARQAEFPKLFETAETIASKSVNCFQCHVRFGLRPAADPIAWAPDLGRVHERLREDWVHRWLVDPSRLYPGTAMPANFSADPPQYQDVYPKSSNEDQIRIVLDWLYNLDRRVPAEPAQ